MAKKCLPPCLMLAAVWACGCGPPQPKIPVGSVDQITMLTAPTPLNRDHVPGPDGLWADVFLFHVEKAKVVAVQSGGTLEMLLFEGPVAPEDISKAEPFHTWRFTAPALSPYRFRSKVGLGYRLWLPWGNKVPASASITLAARYTPLKGRTLYSAPAVLAMRTK